MNRFVELFEELNEVKEKSLFRKKKKSKFSTQKNKAGAIIGGLKLGWEVAKYIMENKGDVSWELPVFKGAKHPRGLKSKYESLNWKATPSKFKVSSMQEMWFPIPNENISASFEVRFKYTGHSVGFVDIQNTGTEDAAGAELGVKVTIHDDPTVHPGDVAALIIVFNYRFEFTGSNDTVRVMRYRIYGNGSFEKVN